VPFMLVPSSTTPQDSSNQASGEPRAHQLDEIRVGASPGTREPALGLVADRRRSDGLGVTVSATPSPGLDSASAPPPRCDGRGHDRGFRDRRGAGCDRPGHDRGSRYRRPDDTNSSSACWSERHVQSPSVPDASSASIEAMIA
jgi:hypothetical protein